MPAFFRPLRPLLIGWVCSLLVNALLSLVLASQIAATISLPLGVVWRTATLVWLPWALVAPLIFRLVSHLPLERVRWRLALPTHLLCGIAIVCFCTTWREALLPRPPDPFPSSGVPVAGSPWHTPPSSRQRWVFALLSQCLPIYLVLVSTAHAFSFYRRTLAQASSLDQARLASLKMQLQPHFLFNSLNAIAELVHRNPDAADEMIVALSKLLRLSLETSGEQMLPLHRELEFVKNYLAIEHVRFGDRLRFELDVPADTQAALVPAFLLQPLVENAVRHGLEPRSGAGLLTVSAQRLGTMLRLSVADNGVGLTLEKPLREGIGLSNTRARLNALFDGAASLELDPGAGLAVHVTIPFRSMT